MLTCADLNALLAKGVLYLEKPKFFLSPTKIQALKVNVFIVVEMKGKVELCDLVLLERKRVASIRIVNTTHWPVRSPQTGSTCAGRDEKLARQNRKRRSLRTETESSLDHVQIQRRSEDSPVALLEDFCIDLRSWPHDHATVFVAKFFGHAGLMSFISNVRENQRPSLLFEACGRTVNPVKGAVGLLWTRNWHVYQAAVMTVLREGTLRPMSELMRLASPVAATDETSEVACSDIWRIRDPNPTYGFTNTRSHTKEPTKLQAMSNLDLRLTPIFLQKKVENWWSVSQADSVVYQTEKKLKELGDKVLGPVKEKVEAKLGELKDAILGVRHKLLRMPWLPSIRKLCSFASPSIERSYRVPLKLPLLAVMCFLPLDFWFLICKRNTIWNIVEIDVVMFIGMVDALEIMAAICMRDMPMCTWG
ncbi:hypothetical protein V8G54_018904 [Vigna mungo]|uniref:LOB domain-containing protein n=1 Tax=Vigna mungo TaxID=3915 RepID=A0AAQ3NB18_VIGMU